MSSSSNADRLRSASTRKAFSTRGKPSLVLGTLALAGSVFAASAVNAGAAAKTKVSSPALRSHSSTTVKPDLAYFRGKQIDLIEYGSAGGLPDLESLILAPYLGAYLHASVTVHAPITGGAGITAQNLAASQPPDGLTIGQMNVVGDVGNFVNNIPGLEFNIRSVPLLSSPLQANTVLATTPKSGLTTFKQVVFSKRPISVLVSAGSSVVVQDQLLFGALHIPNNFIYGYSSAGATISGLVRGDGDTSLDSFTSFQADIIGKIVIPLLNSQTPVKGADGYSDVRKVPTLAQFAAQYPPKGKNRKAELALLEIIFALGPAYFVPVGTQPELQAALSDAFQFALTRGGLKSQFFNIGLPGGYVLPSTLKSNIDSLISQQAQLGAWLRETGAPPS